MRALFGSLRWLFAIALCAPVAVAQSTPPAPPSPPVLFDVHGDAYNTDLYATSGIHDEFDHKSSASWKEFKSSINVYGYDRQAFLSAEWGDGRFIGQVESRFKLDQSQIFFSGIGAQCKDIIVWIRGKPGTQYKLTEQRSGTVEASGTMYARANYLLGDSDYRVSEIRTANSLTREVNGVTYVRAFIDYVDTYLRTATQSEGHAIAYIDLQVTPLYPTLTTDKKEIAFGPIPLNEWEKRPLTLTNSGSGVLNVTDLSTDTFNFQPATGTRRAFSLEPGKSKEITIECRPQSAPPVKPETLIQGKLRIVCNDTDGSVNKDGIYIIPITAVPARPSVINFTKSPASAKEAQELGGGPHELVTILEWQSSTRKQRDLRGARLREFLNYLDDPPDVFDSIVDGKRVNKAGLYIPDHTFGGKEPPSDSSFWKASDTHKYELSNRFSTEELLSKKRLSYRIKQTYKWWAKWLGGDEKNPASYQEVTGPCAEDLITRAVYIDEMSGFIDYWGETWFPIFYECKSECAVDPIIKLLGVVRASDLKPSDQH